MSSTENQQLGERKRIDWAVWDSRSAASMDALPQTRLLDAYFIGDLDDIGRGVHIGS